MDRPLSQDTRRRALAARWAKGAAAVAVIGASLLGARSLLTPSVSRDRIRTARVDVGPVEATIAGAGTVMPALEQVIPSPIDARVLRVLKSAGTTVAPGEPILELDVTESVLALQKLEQGFALKENQTKRSRLDLESTLSGLRSEVEIKKLQRETYAASRERNEKLFAQGLVSEEVLRQSRLDEARTRLELERLEESRGLARRKAETEESALALEMGTVAKERAEARRQLQLATTRSDRAGVLTAIVPEPGAAVKRGDVLARIADLSSFRVDATFSDVHASRVSPGLPALVEIGETRLPGTVARVLPKMQNGVMSVEIALKDPSSPLLRASLRVEAYVVLSRKERALRVARGKLEGSGASPEVFIVRGSTAFKTPIRLGLTGTDRYEITEGLAEGDEVVISDMSGVAHAKEVAIR